MKLSLLALAVMSFASIADGNRGDFYIPTNDDVPEGFEHLAEQSEFFDIYLNGTYIGSSTYSNTVLPNEITGDIKNIITRNVKVNGEIFSNEHIKVHGDLKNNKINIWDTKLNEKPNQVKGEYSPTLRTTFHGLTQQQGGGKQQTYYLDNTFSYDKHQFVSGLSQYNDDVYLRGAYYGLNTGKAYYSAGVLPSENIDSQFSTENQFVGIQADYSKSNTGVRKPIAISLSQPANIYIMRGEKLLSSTRLEEGQHQIPVDALPTGSYSVTLRIEYLNGGTEEQTRYLSSASGLGRSWSIGKITYGAFTEQQFFQETPSHYKPYLGLSVFGYQSETISTQAHFALNDSDFSFSPEVIWTTPLFNSRTQMQIKEQGDYWYYQRFDATTDRNQTYFELRGDKSGDEHFHTMSLTHSQPFISGQLSASVYSRSDAKRKTSYRVTYAKNIPLFDSGFARGSLSLDIADEVVWRLQFNFGKKIANAVDYRLSSYLTEDLKGSQHSLSHSRLTERGSLGFQGYKILNSNDTGGYGIQGKISDSEFGSLDVQSGQIKTGSDVYVNTQFKTSFITSESGVRFTGDAPIKTGFLVDLRDESGTYSFYLNGRKRVFQGGKQYVIAATPYIRYEARLENSKTAGVLVVDGMKEKTLNPGEIHNLDWEVATVKYLVGRILINGEPQANQFVKTAISQGYTDENGYLSIEVPSTLNEISFSNITCQLTPYNTNLLTIGETSCKLNTVKQ
jgi:hypothetical protein